MLSKFRFAVAVALAATTAFALASSWPSRRAEHAAHLSRARAGAKTGSLLATNLASHFSGS